MGQPNAKRLEFVSIQNLTSSANDDFQTLTDTALIKVGDVLEFWDRDAAGCLTTLIGTRTVTGVCPDTSITLDSAIDLTTVSGTAAVRNRNIWDVQRAIERLYRHGHEAQDYLLYWSPAITATLTDTPIVGQSIHTVSDASCFAAGDTWSIISDEGLAGTGTVVSIDAATNQVTIDSNIDAGSLTNPKLINTSVDLKTQLMRLKSLIDQLGAPVCDYFDGDCNDTVYFSSQSMVENSSHFYLDGVKKRKGTAGTRASLVAGAGNAELAIESVVLGLLGNDIDIVIVDPAAASQPLTVSVTGTLQGADRLITVSLATDGGSAITSTALQVAQAINAHPEAKKLVQVIAGGDGSGIVAALAQTPLAGGLNDGTGDYAEIRTVENNQLGGFDLVSLHIRPEENNRLSCAPQESEEIDLCYGKAL